MKPNFSRALLGSIGLLVAIWAVGAPDSLEKLAKLAYYDEVDLNLTVGQSAPDPVVAGTTVSFDLVITNNGERDATDVELLFATDSLVRVVDATCPVFSEIFCRVGDLAAGSSTVITVTSEVDPDALGRSSFVAAAVSNEAEGNPGDEVAQQVLNIIEEADVSVVIADDPQFVGPGGEATVWLGVYNDGPSNAYGVRVGFDPEALSVGAWECFSVGAFDCDSFTGSGPINQNVVISAGGSIHYRVRLQAPLSEGLRQLNASANYARDTFPANNADERDLRIEATVFSDRFQ